MVTVCHFTSFTKSTRSSNKFLNNNLLGKLGQCKLSKFIYVIMYIKIQAFFKNRLHAVLTHLTFVMIRVQGTHIITVTSASVTLKLLLQCTRIYDHLCVYCRGMYLSVCAHVYNKSEHPQYH